MRTPPPAPPVRTVLLVSSGYPPRVASGVGVHVHDLARGLASAGWLPTVVTQGRSDPAEICEDGGVRVVRTRLVDEDGPDAPSQERTVAVCRRIAHEERVSLAHFHETTMPAAAEALQRDGVPIIVTQHSSLGAILDRMKTVAPAGRALPPSVVELQRREEQCLSLADAVICVSDVVAAELRSVYRALPELWVIPNGIDTGRFARLDESQVAEVRRQLIGSGTRLALFAGRAHSVKGLPELLISSSLVHGDLPHARFAFILANMKEHDLQALRSLEALPECDVFRANVPTALMPTYYAAADVVVVSSRSEPCGLVPLEAMAAGRPIVVSDVPPLNGLVVDRVTGRIVPRAAGARGVLDARALADTIADLLRMPDAELEEMGRRARQRAHTDYSIEPMIDRTIHAYACTLQRVKMPSWPRNPSCDGSGRGDNESIDAVPGRSPLTHSGGTPCASHSFTRFGGSSHVPRLP